MIEAIKTLIKTLGQSGLHCSLLTLIYTTEHFMWFFSLWPMQNIRPLCSGIEWMFHCISRKTTVLCSITSFMPAALSVSLLTPQHSKWAPSPGSSPDNLWLAFQSLLQSFARGVVPDHSVWIASFSLALVIHFTLFSPHSMLFVLGIELLPL